MFPTRIDNEGFNLPFPAPTTAPSIGLTPNQLSRLAAVQNENNRTLDTNAAALRTFQVQVERQKEILRKDNQKLHSRVAELNTRLKASEPSLSDIIEDKVTEELIKKLEAENAELKIFNRELQEKNKELELYDFVHRAIKAHSDAVRSGVWYWGWPVSLNVLIVDMTNVFNHATLTHEEKKQALVKIMMDDYTGNRLPIISMMI